MVKGCVSPSIEGSHSNYPYKEPFYQRYTLKALGHETLIELTDNYYRTSTFVFQFGDRVIRKFLVTGHFGIDFVPAKFLTEIIIMIHAEDIDNKWGSKKEFQRNIDDLYSLFTGQSTAKIWFEIHTGAGDDDDVEEEVQAIRLQDTNMTIDTIRPLLLDLDKAGYNLRIDVDQLYLYDVETLINATRNNNEDSSKEKAETSKAEATTDRS
jgi:hypothetical protein